MFVITSDANLRLIHQSTCRKNRRSNIPQDRSWFASPASPGIASRMTPVSPGHTPPLHLEFQQVNHRDHLCSIPKAKMNGTGNTLSSKGSHGVTDTLRFLGACR